MMCEPEGAALIAWGMDSHANAYAEGMPGCRSEYHITHLVQHQPASAEVFECAHAGVSCSP